MADRNAIVRLLWLRGRASWPRLDLPLDTFAEHVVARAPELLDSEPERLFAEDLYLACAGVHGVDGAIEVACEQLIPELERSVRGVERRDHAVHELVQQLVVQLLMPEDGRAPRLAEYSGRGPLRAWARMAARRRCLNAIRDQRRRAELDARVADGTVQSGESPEVAVLRARYRPQVEKALRDAMTALPAAQRGLLRLFYGEHVGLPAIAVMHRWSKPTASRRVAEARQAVLEQTVRLVRERLRLTPSEAGSLVTLLKSDLDVSLNGLFTTAP